MGKAKDETQDVETQLSVGAWCVSLGSVPFRQGLGVHRIQLEAHILNLSKTCAK